jgi:hypothetical protein
MKDDFQKTSFSPSFATTHKTPAMYSSNLEGAMMNLMVEREEEETSQLGVGQLIEREERREEDDSIGDPELSRNLNHILSQ